jgi:Amt family ammonium transporter
MTPDATLVPGDVAWVLTSAALVLVMLPGLALFHSGLVRSKSTLKTMMMALAHWVWGAGGWLRELGARDFAGGTVVHISAAPPRGSRRCWWAGAATTDDALVPHNVPFTLLGAGLLWFGWFEFNAGSALAADAAALTAWILLDLVRTRRAAAVGAATGIVVGLVAVTPAAGFVTPFSALWIGGLAAIAAHLALELRRRLPVDDSLEVFACHGVAGIAGALLSGVFATTSVNPGGADGLLAGNAGQLGVQAVAVAVTMGLSGLTTAIVLVVMRTNVGIRVPLEA